MKRKIKLLFIVISICTMLFAFAINSSAWSVHPHSYSDYAVLTTEDDVVAYVWYYSGYEDCCVSVDFSMDLTNIRSYTLSNNFGANIEYSDEQIFTLIEEYIASVKASMTEGMYSQSQLDSAVAKALEEANLSMGEILWYFPEGTSFNTIQSGTEEYNIKCEFEGSFTTFKINVKDSNDYYKTAIALNVLEFQNFCKLYNLTDISSFNSFMNSLNGQEGISTEVYNWSSPFTYDFLNEESFNFFYNYDLLTEEEYNTSIEQSKTEGVEEYKSSDEYTTILNTQYSTGYSQGEADGVTEFKSSDEYSATLNAKYNDGFVNGTAEGALAYTKSDAYKTALADKYDEGYDDGFVEGEAQFDIAPFIGVISIMALISIGIVIVCWVRKKRIG